jgi:hydrogenase/urease accessory protein HupE
MRAGRLSLFVALSLSVPAAARAHELGTIRTFVTFQRDGTFAVELIVDREHLSPRFGRDRPGDVAGTGPAGLHPQQFNAGTGPTDLHPQQFPVRIGGLMPALDRKIGGILYSVVRGARPEFDGRPVATRIVLARSAGEDDSSVAAGAELRVILTGAIPSGARTFTWSNTVPLGTYMLTLESEGQQNEERQWLENGKESEPFPLAASIVPPTRGEVVRTYVALGYTHILPKGIDHILFVLGIFLLSTRLKPVLLQVTAFTVAHTITLALTIYGVVSLSRAIVEPLIALSIVYVAVENVTTTELKPWRIALVFAFGLLHGMGFAGVLTELGLPRSEFVPALLSFNLGVEAGQLTVIGIALAFFGLPFRRKIWYRSRIVVPASIAIAAVGFYWSVQRVLIR